MCVYIYIYIYIYIHNVMVAREAHLGCPLRVGGALNALKCQCA